MIHLSLESARREEPPFASWKTKVIVRVELENGTTYYRTYVFDGYAHKCRACRNSSRAASRRGRLASTGHTCTQCGNPYAGFVGRLRSRIDGRWVEHRNAWARSGRLH
jgi:hypothetical protein